MDFPLLAGLPDGEVRSVLAAARRRVFAAGEVVFHERDPAETLHLLRTGRLAVQRTTALGKTVTLQIRVPGEVVGEMALVGDDQRRSATVVALERAETLSIHRDEFDALRRRQPAVTEVLVRILVERSRRLSEELTEALYVAADIRVRRRLLQMCEIYRGSDGGPVKVPLAQEDLAELAGTTRATVNRVLRDEASRGTVRLGRGAVEVSDEAAIAKRAR